MNIEPFRVDIPEETLNDLQARLDATRWPDGPDDAGWAYGADLRYMLDLAEYWRDGFDWRAQESYINDFAQYRADIDGVGVHFVHERGRGPSPIPIILTHGWPSSFYEMLPLVRLLTDPGAHGGDEADSFDVVVPSIPGYAFSDRVTRPGFNYRHVADLWVRLMEELGYPRFSAHSYDVGASIMGFVLRRHGERLIGYHTTEPANPAPYLGPGTPPLTDAECKYQELQEEWDLAEGGYMALQTTKPQSLAYGLNDSPAGLAAWIVEKWHSWTDPAGRLDDFFSKDQLLANVTLYWVTETINSANRLYYERAHHPPDVGIDERVSVPLGVTLTEQAIERVPREMVERLFVDIRRWEEFGTGGHFVALERPGLVAEALREFFRPFRSG